MMWLFSIILIVYKFIIGFALAMCGVGLLQILFCSAENPEDVVTSPFELFVFIFALFFIFIGIYTIVVFK